MRLAARTLGPLVSIGLLSGAPAFALEESDLHGDFVLIERCLAADLPLEDFVASLLPSGYDTPADREEALEEVARSLAVTDSARRHPAGNPAVALAGGTRRYAQALDVRSGRHGRGAVVLSHSERPGFLLAVWGSGTTAPVSCDLLYPDASRIEDLALALEIFPEPRDGLPGLRYAELELGPYPDERASTRRAIALRIAKPGPLMLLGHRIRTPGHLSVIR